MKYSVELCEAEIKDKASSEMQDRKDRQAKSEERSKLAEEHNEQMSKDYQTHTSDITRQNIVDTRTPDTDYSESIITLINTPGFSVYRRCMNPKTRRRMVVNGKGHVKLGKDLFNLKPEDYQYLLLNGIIC